MMKKYILSAFLILILAVFVLAPYPASDIYLRFYFRDISGEYCVLYYSTDSSGAMMPEQYFAAKIDPDLKVADFRLEPLFSDNITRLRLDFPNEEQLLNIKAITVSSGGVIKKQYNPCDFFREENIAASNGITGISLVKPRALAYFATSSDDPYVIFSPELTQDIIGCHSNLRLTRLGICLFLAGCFLMFRKKLFTAD